MQGKITNIIPMIGGKVAVTVEVAVPPSDLEGLTGKDLDVNFKEWHGPRTLDQNAFMWACLEELSHALKISRWECYINVLRDSGVEATHLLMDPSAVEAFRKMYRTIHILGDRLVEDSEGNQEWKTEVMAFTGSSKMNTKEMSALIDYITAQMRDLGLRIPEVDT